jgi:hypothetical protein
VETRAAIEIVAAALGDLKARCFLTGGASIPFYISDPLEEAPRATFDIDVVIEVRSAVEYREVVEKRLREQGFRNDASPGAPICRWKWEEVIVDIMPIDASILGFTNPWYRLGLESVVPVEITDRCTWRMLSAPYELAAKLEAFWSRGAADPESSHDLEDIVTLVNGRPELADEAEHADASCRRHVAESFARILGENRYRNALPFHLPYGRAGQQRLAVVMARMERLAGLS